MKNIFKMKPLFCGIGVMLLLFLAVIPTFAGDVPEGFLHAEHAQVFFAEVLAYHSDGENSAVTLRPTQKIKGEVAVGEELIYQQAQPVGFSEPQIGQQYLFGYFDESNPTNIFEVTSYDTATLKLKHITGDMWKRLEKYLNNGDFERAEQKRLAQDETVSTEVGDKISLSELLKVKQENCQSVVLFGRELRYEIDKNSFFELADEIFLTDVKNVLARGENGFFITVYDENKNDTISFWEHCLVSGGRTAMYSAPTGDYTIKKEDYKKLVALFPEEAGEQLPQAGNALVNAWYRFVGLPIPGSVYILFAFVVLAGVCGGVLGYRLKKKQMAKNKTASIEKKQEKGQ